MTKTATRTFASMNVEKAGETPFEFEFLEDGEPTGIFFSVLSSQSKTVKAKIEALLTARRVADAAREMKKSSLPQDNIVPVSSDVEFGQQSAACRLVGWRGLDMEHTPELALELCQTNADVVKQVLAKSDTATNFTKR